MQGPDTEMYQPFGDLIIRQQITGAVTNYRRSLDINQALTTTSFTVGGVHHTREMFISAPDQIMLIRLSASKKGSLNFSLKNNHELAFQSIINDQKELVLKGKARITNDERRKTKPLVYKDSNACDGMRFEYKKRV
jgi:alpha-L-fucosidase 2